MGRVIVAGAGRMTTPSATISLSSIAEGTVVKINEDDSPVEFYVAKQDYESGLNGGGRVLVVRKNCYGNFIWDENAASIGGYIDWVDSNAYTRLNTTYLAKFSEKVQSLIGASSYYASNGKSSGDTDVAATTSAIFLLSTSEYGLTPQTANVEGSALPIDNLIQTATNDAGTKVTQWTRTRGNSSIGWADYLTTAGAISSDHINELHYFRPAFTLPFTAKFDSTTLILKG